MSDENSEVQTNASEAEARKFGWVPKDEWAGDESKWKPAEDFLAKGKEINGFLRRDFEIVNNKLSAKEKELNDLRETVGELKSFYSNMSEKAYEKAMKDLKEQRKKAIELGDGDTFDAVEEQIEDLKANKPSKEDKKKTTLSTEEAKAQEALEGFLQENPIFATDVKVQAVTDGLAALVRQQNPNLPYREFLDLLAAEVKATIPDKFENPNSRKKSAVGSSSDSGGSSGSEGAKRSYKDLPPEAKAACDRFVKQKLMTQDEYLNSYQWD